MSNNFDSDLDNMLDDARQYYLRVTRLIVIKILGRLIYLSPVGNPSLWKVNKARVEYNQKADDYNHSLYNDSRNITKSGRLKRGLKLGRRKLSSPSGYSGGMFRANWQVGVDYDPSVEVTEPDKSGDKTMQIGSANANEITFNNNIVYIANILPYAQRLEDGHSGQAPSGIVKVVMSDIDDVIREALEDAE